MVVPGAIDLLKPDDFDWNETTRSGAVAELFVFIPAPALRATVDNGATCGYRSDTGSDPPNLGGRRAVLEVGAIAELKFRIGTPTLCASIALCTGKILPSCDGRKSSCDSLDLSGNRTIDRAAIAELADVIVAPALGNSISDGAGMIVSGGYGCYKRGQPNDLNGHSTVRHGTITELPICVSSPALRTAVDDSASVRARANCTDTFGEPQNLNGYGTTCGGPTSKRTAAPAPSSSADDRVCVVPSGSQGCDARAGVGCVNCLIGPAR